MKTEPKVPLWKKVVATVAAALTVGGAGAGIAAGQAKEEAERPPVTQAYEVVTQNPIILDGEAKTSVRGQKAGIKNSPPVTQPHTVVTKSPIILE